jgi:hypothetical protein
MKSILALIEEKQKVYAQLPFFQFMRDQTISPRKRLAFAPCAAPFIMSFADLNKYALRQEPTKDKIQLILNQHTYEDDFHWQWFLEDMQKLGFNCSLEFNESLKLLWSDKTKNSRLLAYQLYEYIAQSEPIEKLIILEAIEATADIFLFLTRKITNELRLDTNQEYRYFGDCHVEQETSHNANSTDVNEFINNMYLSEASQLKGFELVDKVFTAFTQWTYELLAYAQSNQGLQTSSQLFESRYINAVA